MTSLASRLVPTIAERVTRARGDLAMGLPCHVTFEQGQACVVGVEGLTQDRLEALRGLFGTPELVLTQNRARSVLKDRDEGLLRIAAPADAQIGWFLRLSDPAYEGLLARSGPLHVLPPDETGVSDFAVSLTKYAELLPAAVVFMMPSDMKLPSQLSLTRLEMKPAKAHLAQAVDLSVISSANLPLQCHDAGRLHVFKDPSGIHEHVALEIGSFDRAQPLLCRLHSACFTGDVLGSLKCDCGPQLHAALNKMGSEGAGVLLYLNQEGRGIGLANKMRVYDLQSQGFDTVEANHMLGYEDDERDFRVASVMLKTLGIGKVRLMTNNPAKVKIMQDHGTDVVEQIPLRVGKNIHNRGYLSVKALKSGHAL